MTPSPSRSRTLPAAVLMSAVTAAFFSSFAFARTVPSVFDVLFGALPFFALAAALLMAACRMLRVGPDEAQDGTVRILLVAAAVAALASLLGAWDNIAAVLLPHQALFSLLTGGLWPLGEGPLAVMRFIPVIASVGLFVVARRAGVSEGRSLCAAIAVFFAQAAATYALSWIVWVYYTLGSGEILENVQDAFRIFVSSNVNGYWTNSQSERFLATAGGQAETGMQALQGAFAFACAVVVTAGTWVPWKRVAASWREMLDLGSLRHAALVAFGALIGLSVRMGGAPFADIIAWTLFLGAVIGWLAAWALEDIEKDAAAYCQVMAALCACLLGWPVLAGLVTADLIRRTVIRHHAWPGMGAAVIVHLSSGFALAWTGLAFGLRDLPIAVWMLRPLAAVAFLAAASWLGTKLLRSALAPQWQIGYVLGSAAFSVLISAQKYFILPLMPLAFAVWWLHGREALWDRWKSRLLDLYVAALVLFCLVFPSGLTR